MADWGQHESCMRVKDRVVIWILKEHEWRIAGDCDSWKLYRKEIKLTSKKAIMVEDLPWGLLFYGKGVWSKIVGGISEVSTETETAEIRELK